MCIQMNRTTGGTGGFNDAINDRFATFLLSNASCIDNGTKHTRQKKWLIKRRGNGSKPSILEIFFLRSVSNTREGTSAPVWKRYYPYQTSSCLFFAISQLTLWLHSSQKLFIELPEILHTSFQWYYLNLHISKRLLKKLFYRSE